MSLFFQHAGSMAFWTAVTGLILFLLGRKHIHGRQDVFKLLLISYIVGICSQTLFPFIDYGIDSATGTFYLNAHYGDRGLSGLNLIPFKTILAEITGNIPELSASDRPVRAVLNLAGNLFLYLPVGLFLPLAWERFRKPGATLALAALLSAIIEILQLAIGRIADIDDVLLHLLGAAVGYGVWLTLRNFPAGERVPAKAHGK